MYFQLRAGFTNVTNSLSLSSLHRLIHLLDHLSTTATYPCTDTGFPFFDFPFGWLGGKTVCFDLQKKKKVWEGRRRRFCLFVWVARMLCLLIVQTQRDCSRTKSKIVRRPLFSRLSLHSISLLSVFVGCLFVLAWEKREGV